MRRGLKPGKLACSNKLMFAARVRNGCVPALRATVFRKFKGLQSRRCLFANLPESERGGAVITTMLANLTFS